jgi:hypothetical protein
MPQAAMKYTPLERYLVKLGAKAYRLNGKNIKIQRNEHGSWWCPPNSFAWRKVDELPLHNEDDIIMALRTPR